jgi:2'-5' RNA ligase
MSLSCFVVLVPEAEDLVGALRTRFDDSARRGLGAHITVLYPFMAPQRLDAVILKKAAGALAAQAQFSFQLKSVGRFPEVAYLAPEPAEAFVALTLGLARAFPLFPPYGGEFQRVIPHLTVAKGDLRAAESDLDCLSSRLALQGCVSARCTHVTLIENSSGRWQPLHAFELDGASD